MKNLFVFIAFALAFQSSFATLSVQVDERSELLSIVCRLSEYKEYVNNNVKNYTEDIDSCFAPYATLPLIDYAKEIRKTNGISYDAIAGLIPFMEIKNKKILFTQDAFKEISEKDSRWNVDILSKYAILLNDFYKKVNFNRFFNKHSSLYSITETRFNETITSRLNLSWFDETFGAGNTNFHIVLSLCNGPSNYGPSNKKDDYYAIVGVSSIDSVGLPYFEDYIIETIIHEFSHSYCNPICLKYKDEMHLIFDTLFPYVKKDLDKAYITLMFENLTRLSALLYLRDQQMLGVHHIVREEQSGFPWMYYLLLFYNNFTNNRNIYPDFESFIPEYIQFMKGIVDQIEEIIFDYKSKIPRVVSVFPPNGSTVSSQIKEARIIFNVPMRLASGIRPLDNNSENRKSFIRAPRPPFEHSLSLNKRTIIIPIDLEENTKYGCILKTFFRSEEGYDATEEYEWIFDTK